MDSRGGEGGEVVLRQLEFFAADLVCVVRTVHAKVTPLAQVHAGTVPTGVLESVAGGEGEQVFGICSGKEEEERKGGRGKERERTRDDAVLVGVGNGCSVGGCVIKVWRLLTVIYRCYSVEHFVC